MHKIPCYTSFELMTVTPSVSDESTTSEKTDHSDPPPGDIADKVSKLKQAIWDRRPILGEIMQKNGDKTLYRYSKDFMDVNPLPGIDERKEELIVVAADLIEKRLGADVAQKMAKQLRKLPLVSTADHHSFIDHPFWVNANLISAIPYIESKDPDIHYLVVFSFASVSVNNASGFPRGILFHGGINGSGNMMKMPVLPDKLKMGTVYGMEPYNRNDLDRVEASLQKKASDGEILKKKADDVTQVLETFFAGDTELQAPDLSSQITEVNYRLWPKLFHHTQADGAASTMAHVIPDLIYLEIETIVAETLRRHHLDGDTLIHKALFDPTYQTLILRHFNGLPGAFSLENNWGTHLFWGIDAKLHRVRLSLKDGELRSEDGSIVVPFTPQGVREALDQKKMFPAMALCYLVVSLYYGMKCLGGFCQVHDLTMMKAAWMKILEEAGEKKESEALIPLQTKELGGDGMVLAYFATRQETLVPATGIDMVLEKVNTSYDSYIELSKNITLSEAMSPLLPEMYTVLYSQQDRDPALLTTPEEILRESGLEKKLIKELGRANMGTVA